MAEYEADILSTIRGTETWQEWGRRYQRKLEGQGEEPFRSAEAYLTPIPPDTIASLREDLHKGVDTVPFSKIQEELSPEKIEAVLGSCSAFGNVAEMHFFKKS